MSLDQGNFSRRVVGQRFTLGVNSNSIKKCQGREGKEGKKRGEGMGGHSWQERKDYARKGGKRGKDRRQVGRERGERKRRRERGREGEREKMLSPPLLSGETLI